MASGTPSAQVRTLLTDPLFSHPPSLFCSHYSTWGKIIRERQRTVDGGVKIIRLRNFYAAAECLSQAGAGGPKSGDKIRKLSHSAENTLFHILIHYETIPYPHTLPKTLS